MKFGHHGLNHPVLDLYSGRIYITSQNHGFAVSEDSLPEGVELWMRNANDGSVEALRHSELPIASVQFHPEAAPGPHDTLWIFDEFISIARKVAK
jgi:carbamoyl-phosphate synthase small subunit